MNDNYIKECMPFVVLLETDGGPDHNIIFFEEFISSLSVFLVGEMDNLDGFCGCPGQSYLNTFEPAWIQTVLTICLVCLMGIIL